MAYCIQTEHPGFKVLLEKERSKISNDDPLKEQKALREVRYLWHINEGRYDNNGRLIGPTKETLEAKPKDRKLLTVEDRKIPFSSTLNPFGLSKQDLLSQFLNSTVDIATKPYFVQFNFTTENIGSAVYLLHFGWHPRTITFLMNQPVIRAYNDEVTKLTDSRMKRDVKLKYLTGETKPNFNTYREQLKNEGYDIPKGTVGIDKILDILAQQIDKGQSIFKNENLKSNMVNYIANNKVYVSDLAQRQIFAFYLKTQKQAEHLRTLQTTAQMDTRKIASPIEAIQAQITRDQVLEEGLFDEEAVMKIWNNSMVSSFDTYDTIIGVFKALMPVAMDEEVIKLGVKLLSELYGNDKKKRFPKIFFNDWMEFLIKNYAKTPDGINIQTKGNMLRLYDRASHNITLTDTLKNIKLRYPDLLNTIFLSKLYPLIDDLIVTIEGRPKELRNIELSTGLEYTTEAKNIMTEEFNMLLNFQGTEILKQDGKPYTAEEASNIRRFANELRFLAFDQSGFNMSPISFFNLVPYQQMMDIFKEALDEYQAQANETPGFKETLISEFERLFKLQNKTFEFFKFNEEMKALVNPRPHKGKFYNINARFLKVAKRYIPSPIRPIIDITSTPVVGIDISSRSTDPLGRALTNPTWGSVKDGKNYLDVETIYKANKAKIGTDEEKLKADMNTMYKLIVQKFKQNPELIDEVTKRGGIPFLEASSHIIGVKNSRWEGKGTESNFIKVLIEAYETASKLVENKSIGTSEDIYSQLGDKTKSENVRIHSWSDLKDATSPYVKVHGIIAHIISTRIKNSNEHFGNLFSSDETILKNNPSLIRVNSTKEAVERYIDWVINSQDTRAKWIRSQLETGELKGKNILYYKELGEPSHATALDYLINKYNWNIEEDISDGAIQDKMNDCLGGGI